jgi:hypothetical protein
MPLGGFTPNRGLGIILKKLTLCALLLVGALVEGLVMEMSMVLKPSTHKLQ